MFASAWLHVQTHDAVLKAILLQTHRSMGLTLWAATVVRLVWRLTHAKLPPFPSDMTKIHRAVVQEHPVELVQPGRFKIPVDGQDPATVLATALAPVPAGATILG